MALLEPSKILALDLATTTGWALFDLKSKRLLKYGAISVENSDEIQKASPYPYNYIALAKFMAEQLVDFIKNNFDIEDLDAIYIEETNGSKYVFSQKKLEFYHAFSLDLLITKVGTDIRYIRSSAWRKTIGLRMTKEDKKHNALVSKKKAKGRITQKHLSVRMVNELYSLSLKQKDDDIADAICLGRAALEGAETCKGPEKKQKKGRKKRV